MKKIFFFSVFFICFFALFAEEVESEKESASPEFQDDFIIDIDKYMKNYVSRQVLLYEKRIKEYQESIRSLMERKVIERENRIMHKYKDPIEEQIEKEISNRADALVLFENFVEKYPDNKEYTPGAMYRLAELYYEKSFLEFEEENTIYDELLAKYEQGLMEKEPELPVVDFSESVRVYRNIIEKFPDFEYIGGTYYMLGYCLNEMKEFDKAVSVWETIIEENIETPYKAEIYLRIGDHYFDAYKGHDLEKAEEYFKKGIEFEDSDFYDKILYKYAWTLYRRNEFQKAVDQFVALINFADRMKEEGELRGQDLRKEAVQYVAISFADEEWGSVDKAIDYFESLDGEKFEKDVFKRLGTYYSENSNYQQAEKAYRYILNKYPYFTEAPELHMNLIEMYNKMREFNLARQETEIFARKYDRDSEWARRNRANATAVKKAAEMAEKSLLNTASYHHRQAQSYRGDGRTEEAKKEYLTAAEVYSEYLDKFPYTSESYEIMYNYADALFYAGEIPRAVVAYERVRDDDNQDRFKSDAALQTYVCYSRIWEAYVEIEGLPEDRKGKPFSKLEKKLIEASDIYIDTADKVENKAAVEYNTARIFFDHGKYEEARKRYMSIIDESPENPIALNAARDVITSYSNEEDWVNVAKWAKTLQERLESTGDDSRQQNEEFKTYRTGALFQYAQELEKEKKYEKAAEEYLRLVEENPGADTADSALFNAAINYQRAVMFDSALQIYERVYEEYPYSDMAPKALYLVAYSAENSFNFEKALKSYQLYSEKYPDSENKNTAVWNAAFLNERLQNYKKAAEYYKRYYSMNPEEPEGKEALYIASDIYKQSENWKRMIREKENFIRRFKGDSTVTNFVMDCFDDIARVYEEKLNNWPKAREYYAQMLDFYKELEDKDEYTAYAAHAEFKLLEDDFNDFLEMKITGRDDDQLAENLKKKSEKLKELLKAYGEIFNYGVFNYTIAAIYKQGRLYQSFADALFSAEPPSGLTLEEEDIYMEMLREQSEPLEREAVEMYRRAVERANELKVFNKWTQRVAERLAAMRPEEYQVGKKPEFVLQYDFESGYAPVLSLNKREKKDYSEQTLGDMPESVSKEDEELNIKGGENSESVDDRKKVVPESEKGKK